MDNIQKAITMAGHVIMFLIALSIGINLYQTLMNVSDSVLLSSEEFSQRAEQAKYNMDEDFTRTITKAEVIGTLISFAEGNGFVANSIVIDGNTFTKANIKDIFYVQNLNNKVTHSKYKVSYAFSSDGSTVSVEYTGI